MSNAAVEWAYKQHVKPAARKLVLVTMCVDANGDPTKGTGTGEMFPSLARLVDRTDLCRRDVVEHRQALAEDGLIVEVDRRHGKGRPYPVYRPGCWAPTGTDRPAPATKLSEPGRTKSDGRLSEPGRTKLVSQGALSPTKLSEPGRTRTVTTKDHHRGETLVGGPEPERERTTPLPPAPSSSSLRSSESARPPSPKGARGAPQTPQRGARAGAPVCLDGLTPPTGDRATSGGQRAPASTPTAAPAGASTDSPPSRSPATPTPQVAPGPPPPAAASPATTAPLALPTAEAVVLSGEARPWYEAGAGGGGRNGLAPAPGGAPLSLGMPGERLSVEDYLTTFAATLGMLVDLPDWADDRTQLQGAAGASTRKDERFLAERLSGSRGPAWAAFFQPALVALCLAEVLTNRVDVPHPGRRGTDADAGDTFIQECPSIERVCEHRFRQWFQVKARQRDGKPDPGSPAFRLERWRRQAQEQEAERRAQEAAARAQETPHERALREDRERRERLIREFREREAREARDPALREARLKREREADERQRQEQREAAERRRERESRRAQPAAQAQAQRDREAAARAEATARAQQETPEAREERLRRARARALALMAREQDQQDQQDQEGAR